MGCTSSKNEADPEVEGNRIVKNKPIVDSINSVQISEKKAPQVSTVDENNNEIINSENSENFVEIQVADPQAFNDSFIQQREQAIDNANYRSTIESWHPTSLSELVDSIKVLSKDKSLIECHWIIFYWITCNIEYDTVAYFSKNYGDQTAEDVFQTKKGVCASYANIYQYLCKQLNMPCEIVSGYSKGYGFDEGEGALKEVDHAWNVVEIDHHWYLIESSWGAGHLTDAKIFKRELNSYYFCARPNEMIYQHLPENIKWQLLQEPINSIQYLQMPKIQPTYFDLNLELINPRHQAYVNLLPNESHALVDIWAPSDVHLTADLKLHDQKIVGGHQVLFDKEKQLYSCYFAPQTIGKHKITIYEKRGELENGTYNDALNLILDIKEIPKGPISFPKTWNNFFDLNLNMISPKNTHLIKISNETHTEILIHTPNDVDLLGRLVDANDEKIEGAYQVYYDRCTDLWRCKFALNHDGLFSAEILAKKKSDTGKYTSAVSFIIDAKSIPTPPLSYPQTWQLFHDLNLKIEAPENRAVAVWPQNASFSEIRISTPDDVEISCAIQYDGVKEENCGLAQFDHDKKQWQLLFAPQHTGTHKLIIYARRESDLNPQSSCVAQFDLNVTELGETMQFPLTYKKFRTNRCRIYEPLNGILKKEAIVPIHCFIPGAIAAGIQVDSKWVSLEDYKDSILKTEITVGSTDVTIYAKYEENKSYDGLVRYSVS